MDFRYDFYFPDGTVAESFYLTEEEVKSYNILTEELMDIAMNYYETHKDQYNNVMEVYGQCYYTQNIPEPLNLAKDRPK